jgi:hypothetical protein
MHTDAATQLWDMPSACAIARCIVEAICLGYIFAVFSSSTNRLHLPRKLHDSSDAPKNVAIDAIHESTSKRDCERNDLAREAEAHPWFAKIG